MNKKLLIAIGSILIALVLLVTCVAAAFLSGGKSYVSVVKSGYRYLEQGDYENAILMFNEARGMDGTRMEAYYGLYQAYVRSGQNANAIAALNSGVMATNNNQLSELLQQIQGSNIQFDPSGQNPTLPTGNSSGNQSSGNENDHNDSYFYASLNTNLLNVVTRSNYSDYLLRYGYASGVMSGDEFSVHLRDLGATLIYKIGTDGSVIDPATNAPRDNLMPDRVVMDDITVLFGGGSLTFGELQYMKGIQFPNISGNTITFHYLDCKVTITCDQNTRITSDSPNYLEPAKRTDTNNRNCVLDATAVNKDGHTPLSGVKICVYDGTGYSKGAKLSEGTTNSTGRYQVNLPGVGVYYIEATKDGFVGQGEFMDITENMSVLDARFELEEEVDPGEEQLLTLTVVDATNTQPISGAEVTLVNPDGNYVIGRGNTDANGKIFFTVYGGVTYNAQVKKNGYIDDNFDVQIQTGMPTTEQTLQISPVMQADEIRLVLTWDADPRDLDSHLQGTSASGRSVHVWFSNQINMDSSGNKIAELDVDDTSSYGPETTTLYQTNGNYEFLVHKYDGNGTISEGNAVVKIYVGNALYATVEVADGVDDLWHVCTIVDGRITVTNRSN